MRIEKDLDTLNKFVLYTNAFNRVSDEIKEIHLDGLDDDLRPLIYKAITYGVKAINLMPRGIIPDEENALYTYDFTNEVKSVMANLTPIEMMGLYPIDKIYNGHLRNVKDYFTTKKYLSKLKMNEVIGKNEIINFLLNYRNKDLNEFLRNYLDSANFYISSKGLEPLYLTLLKYNYPKGSVDENIVPDSHLIFDPKTGMVGDVKKGKIKVNHILDLCSTT